MNSLASATIAAFLTNASLESGLPYLIFSSMVVGNNVMCWSTNAIDDLKDFNFHSLMSLSTHSIEPSFISAKRNISLTNVVFPEPVEPTTPVVFPAFIVKSNSEKISSLPGYLKLTFFIIKSEVSISLRSGVYAPSSISIGDSNTSNTRVEDAIAL